MSARALEDVVADIGAAPFHVDGWNTAIAAMTEVVGGWAGQMLAQSNTRLYLNTLVDAPAELAAGYVANGAADPARNPRLAAMLKSAPMRPISDQHYIAESDKSRYPIYRDFFDGYDLGFLASIKIADVGNAAAAVTCVRSRRSGDFDSRQLDLLGKLAPHVRAAFEVQMAIDTEAVELALGALEDFALAALVCDVDGRLVASSPGGEAFLRSGAFLGLRAGLIRAADRASGERLQRAIRLARSPWSLETPSSGAVALIDPTDGRMRRVKVAPFPRHSPWGLVGGVLLAIEPARRAFDPARLHALGLTAAEADVAIWTARGAPVHEIAARRGVGRETVRSQLKSVYAKFGVRNAVQLGAKLSDLF